MYFRSLFWKYFLRLTRNVLTTMCEPEPEPEPEPVCISVFPSGCLSLFLALSLSLSFRLILSFRSCALSQSGARSPPFFRLVSCHRTVSLSPLILSLSLAVNLLSPTQFTPHSLFAYSITLAPPPISLPLFLSSLFIFLFHTHTHTHPYTHTRIQVSSIRGYGDDHYERLPVSQVRTHWAARHLCTHQSGMITLPSPSSTHHGQSAPFKPGIHDAN